MDLLEQLNPVQREAVTHPDGPLLIFAGAGSGKTRVLTHRIAYLVNELHVPPWRIMAMTFTNKAAREMMHRVEGLLGGRVKGLTMGTFHSICARILRREAERVGLTRDYVIFDTADQRALMKVVITEDLNLDDKRYPPERVLGRISNAKNELIRPDGYRPSDYFDEIVKRAYQYYEARLIANNAVDFDDLLMHTALLFREHHDVLARYQNSVDHVLVDEFQDTNAAQYELLRLLTARSKNIFCVGDEDQSIYRWRGADYRNINRLRRDFPELQTVLLEQNYRSTQVILDAAQAVIDRNTHRTPKRLFTDREGGPKIVLYEAHNEQYEAEFVVEQIALLVKAGEAEPGQCAVMYRTNAQSRALEDAFIRHNLPYRLVGATRFYGRREIKDVLAYLRIIHNPDDSLSLMRVINTPPRGIGDKTIASLQAWAESNGISLFEALTQLSSDPSAGPLDGRARRALGSFAEMLNGWRAISRNMAVGDLLKLVLDETGYLGWLDDGSEQGRERVENVMELVNVAAEAEDLPLQEFLEEVALVSDVDTLTEDVNAPSLMTLHAAKGLEFDVVFLVGLEEGVLPHQRSIEDPDAEQMAEERRLMYVGMTRARKYLYLVYCFRRTVWGESSVNMRSRFIDDIPPELLVPPHAAFPGMPDIGGPPRRMGGPPRVRSSAQMEIDLGESAIRTGMRVLHPKFGEGIVVASRMSGDDQEVSVMFDEAGLKRLMVSFANLTVLDG